MSNTRTSRISGYETMDAENAAFEALPFAVREALREAPYDFLAVDALEMVDEVGEGAFLRDFRRLCAVLVAQRTLELYGEAHPQARAA